MACPRYRHRQVGAVDRKGRMKDGYMELLSIKTAEAPQAAQ